MIGFNDILMDLWVGCPCFVQSIDRSINMRIHCRLNPLRDAKRDTLPSGQRVYELVLTYNWEAKEKTKVVLRAPMLQGMRGQGGFALSWILPLLLVWCN